ncbi:MAG TPA: helix-turn-helix domain-containing protein [Verrucomicrobiae bacterium]|jgi:hypothetical protein
MRRREHTAKIRNQSLAKCRPFSSVWQASTLLDCTERRIYHDVQAGRLPLAFDLSYRGDRLFLRVATASVVAVQRRRPPAAELAPFLAEIAPETKISFRVPELARMWQCDPDHIYHLLADGILEDIGGATRYRVPRDSVMRFLAERRVK